MAFLGLYLIMKMMMNQLVAIITEEKRKQTYKQTCRQTSLGFAVGKVCSSLIEALNYRPQQSIYASFVSVFPIIILFSGQGSKIFFRLILHNCNCDLEAFIICRLLKLPETALEERLAEAEEAGKEVQSSKVDEHPSVYTLLQDTA